MTSKKGQQERQQLCDLFTKAARVGNDGHTIKVGKAEARYKWRFVYGLKSQWETYVPRFLGDKSRFYPLGFDKDDHKGVIECLAAKEADRIMEERAAQKVHNRRSPV